jgi:hypothetical protein
MSKTEKEESSKWEEEKKMQEGLPEEIKGKKYRNELELIEDLQRLGVRDLEIVLDKNGLAVWREIPGEQHGVAVEDVINHFDEWKDGRAIKGQKSANIFVNDSFNVPKNHLRVANFAMFGTDRLEGRFIRKVKTMRKRMNPHVIFQFSWTNDIVEEALAIDDMMHHAGVGEYNGLGRPNAAYLIKALIRGNEINSPVYGFDIFVVRQGGNTPEEPTMKYRVGVQEDTEISIAPAVMGLNDNPGEPFKIEMRSIREQLEALGTVFIPANENEI